MIRPTASFQPIAPVHAPTRVVPTATPQVQGRAGTGASGGTQAQQTAKFAAALVNSSRELSRRDLFAKINALQSQASKQHELSHLLAASHERGMDDSARLLRLKLKKGLLQQAERGMLLKQVLDSASGNIARAHAMLQAASRQARSERSVNEQQMLNQQLLLLREQYGRAPRQPLNTGGMARSLSRANEDPQRRDKLRGVYSVAVADQLNVLGLIEALMSSTEDEGQQGQGQNSREQFESMLREVRQVAARDLAELDSSASPQKLRTMMYAVSTAQYVATLFGSCEHLLGRMRNKNPGVNIEASAFLRNLLGLIGKGMALNETLQLTQQIGGGQLKHQLAFLNGLRPMLHQLPIMLWRDVKSRQNALGNLLTLMAALTSEEQKRMRAGVA